MKKRTHLYTCTLAILLFISGCDKGPELTPITQEGKNTFSCKINGKVWIPKGRGDIYVNIPPIDGGFYYDYSRNKNFGNIKIFAHGGEGEDLELFLNTNATGIHLLDQNTSFTAFSPSNFGYFRTSNKSTFLTSAKNTGKVTITKSDTVSGIISGVFEFAAGNSKGELITITDGRFDIKSPL